MSTTSYPEWLAGGTDLLERRRSGVAPGPVTRLTDVSDRIEGRIDGRLIIGAAVRVQDLADAPGLMAGWPGLAAAAADLATPEIRRRATVGGNLAQRTRCAYFRSRDVTCLKKGGVGCPARIGAHDNGVVFDLGPCVHPHPSTLAAALLAYAARMDTDHRTGLGIPDLLGNGSDGTVDHTLAPGERLLSIELPPPVPGERAVYLRAASRQLAEWPIVELILRIIPGADGHVSAAHVAVGGVAPVPLLLPDVAASLVGNAVSALPVERAADAAIANATPLPGTTAKVPILRGIVAAAVEAVAAMG